MDTQTPMEVPKSEFAPGSSVIYALHGKCHVLGTEFRSLGGKPICFYKLELRKSTLSRSTRNEPAIWVPVASAKDFGLRAPMTAAQADEAMKLLMNREYFFKPYDAWNVIQPQLEATIRNEGGLGLAKVVSFLYVLKRKQVVATPEVVKLYDTVHKLLFRELSEALQQPMKVLEEKVAKGMKTKLLPDT